MFASSPDSVPKIVKQKWHWQEATTYKAQQGTRPRMPYATVHWRRNEHKGGTAAAAKEAVARQD